jgi:hypothetical protein
VGSRPTAPTGKNLAAKRGNQCRARKRTADVAPGTSDTSLTPPPARLCSPLPQLLGLDQSAGAVGVGNSRGGPQENVLIFGERAGEANLVLRLYEAATSPYGPDVETIKNYITMPEVPHQQSWLARPKARETVTDEGNEVKIVEQSPLAKPQVLDLIGESLQEIAVKQRSRNDLGRIALDAVNQIVSERLAAECSQGL